MRTVVNYISDGKDDYGNSILGHVYYTGVYNGVETRMSAPLYSSLPVKGAEGEFGVIKDSMISYVWLQGSWVDMGPVNLVEDNPYQGEDSLTSPEQRALFDQHLAGLDEHLVPLLEDIRLQREIKPDETYLTMFMIGVLSEIFDHYSDAEARAAMVSALGRAIGSAF